MRVPLLMLRAVGDGGGDVLGGFGAEGAVEGDGAFFQIELVGGGVIDDIGDD